MDFQTLRVFAAVAHEGSLTRAAERVHLTQPAVGLQIKSLEDETRLVLFNRTPRGMCLTGDGEALLPLAEKILWGCADFKSAAARQNAVVSGSLSIGTILDPEFIRLGALLRELITGPGHIHVTLQHGMSGEVLSNVDKGTLDVGFYLGPPAKGGSADHPGLAIESRHADRFKMLALTNFTYKIVGPVGWGLKIIGSDWNDLGLLPWLATPPASVHGRLLSRFFGPDSFTGIEPKRVARVDQESSMIELVKSGAGLSLIRDHIALREAQAHGLVIADRVEIECILAFICLRSRAKDPVIESAWSAMSSIWNVPPEPLSIAGA